jgi:uncharacterized protein (DUF1800 family)
MALPSPPAIVSHVLRRTTFGPSAAQIARFTDGQKDARRAALDAVDWALSASPRALNPGTLPDDGWDPALRGWIDNLRSPDAGLHEKMTWFWHSHFATSSEKVGNMKLLHRQQGVFREHATGNFAALLRAMLADPALLLYLDASGSTVDAPNENLARELMELFALGRGSYTEADVKAGALVLAGLEVDYESGAVKRNGEASLGGEVVFLGRRGRLSPDDLVDVLLAQPRCAEFLVTKIHTYLVGVAPTPQRTAALAARLRSGQYDLGPVLADIVRHDSFLAARRNRPRYAIEWFVAALAAIGEPRKGEDTDIWPWTLEQLDQLPYRPPNVAGWQPGRKWLSASQQLTRASYAYSLSWRMQPLEGRDLVGAALRRCGLYEVSAATRTALQQAALAEAGSADALSVSQRLIVAALLSPEFALA